MGFTRSRSILLQLGLVILGSAMFAKCCFVFENKFRLGALIIVCSRAHTESGCNDRYVCVENLFEIITPAPDTVAETMQLTHCAITHPSSFCVLSLFLFVRC